MLMFRLDVFGSQPDGRKERVETGDRERRRFTTENAEARRQRAHGESIQRKGPGSKDPGYSESKAAASAEEFANQVGEAGAFFLAHLHELDAHAVAGL